ncbi:flavodoxin family protein [Burkholderia ubonensis]|uniref:flavodoxin family protein n=1 Tax=Burkholderia ubonensis TaxID=101571 RepID=UPI000A8DF1B8|nr:hypothetical protein [Burkholderia ubonensis]
MYADKILVVFYSRTGTTRRAGAALATMLHADVEEIVETHSRIGPFGFLRSLVEAINRKPAEIAASKRDPSAYDLVVIGTPVWAGSVSSPVRLSRCKSAAAAARRVLLQFRATRRGLRARANAHACAQAAARRVSGDRARGVARRGQPDSDGVCRTGHAQIGGSDADDRGTLMRAYASSGALTCIKHRGAAAPNLISRSRVRPSADGLRACRHWSAKQETHHACRKSQHPAGRILHGRLQRP